VYVFSVFACCKQGFTNEKGFVLFELIGAAHAMGGQPVEGGPHPLLAMAPYLLMFVILYFLLIRPQIKKQKAQQQLIEELKKGDRVVTSGGIHGVIVSLKEDTMLVKVAENVKMEIARAAVSKVLNKEDSGS
jgi:preprotein translocase subunit YajC